MKSLRTNIIAGSAAIALTVFLLFAFAVKFLFENNVKENAQRTAAGISRQVFHSMFQIMRMGWSREDMLAFLKGLEVSFEDTNIQLGIFRSPLIEEKYGVIEQGELSSDIRSVMASGRQLEQIRHDTVLFVYPLQAKAECMGCHSNAKPGEVLGVIEVTENVAPVLNRARNQVLQSLLFISPIPILIIILISGIFLRRINRSVNQLRDATEKISSVNDLTQIKVQDMHVGFRELDIFFHSFSELLHKLKDIAADKELLEFEVRLLDKFIITSDVIRDWRDHVKSLLMEINQVIEAYSMFIIFKVEEEAYNLDIFWRNKPDETTEKMIEDCIYKRLEEKDNFIVDQNFEVAHYISDPHVSLPTFTKEDIEVQTRTLFLSAPRIGGVVGIGVQSQLSEDNTRYIVIENILPTLVNVVGSVKAIFKYTKDLEYYAMRDPLTNLYNQRVFRELLVYEIRRAEQKKYHFAVIVIDFDNFKHINDTYGHNFGDRFLKTFGLEIRNAMREEDIVARYGGDEFTAILPEATVEEANAVANNIMQTLSSISMLADDGKKIKATISLGISIYPDHGKTDHELFTMADSMMYKAKREGKNRIGLPSGGDVEENQKKLNETTMLVLNALESESITPYFQPIKDVKTGEIPIHEMLMRIQIENEIIPANEFIDIAETLGIVQKLDYILVRKAFQKIKETNYNGILFVNLSPRSMTVKDFIENLSSLAKEYKIPPANVVFELTERETVKNLSILEKFVMRLREEGFKFAIDDFGSGFSSYHYLKQFPIDYIKIEGDFIRNVSTNRIDRAFIKSIITLAKELGVQTIGEFVEDESSWKELSSFGIDYGQGYYIAAPSTDFYTREETFGEVFAVTASNTNVNKSSD